MKGKFVGKVNDKYGKYVDLMYEYKGKSYFVRNHYVGNSMGESLSEQHKKEQKKIDELIAENKKSIELPSNEVENALSDWLKILDAEF